MIEPENHTLAWMRRIDAKLGEVATEIASFRAETEASFAQLRDEAMVTSAICLRLEAREVEAKDLLALYQRLKAGHERLERRVAALESHEPV
jgi:hypothetical protein